MKRMPSRMVKNSPQKPSTAAFLSGFPPPVHRRKEPFDPRSLGAADQLRRLLNQILPEGGL
jgi:hypothetical protein